MTARRNAVRREPLVQQAAVLPWRKTVDGDIEIMLITSLGTGRWVLPKGKLEGAELPQGAARREAMEEAGLRGRVESKALGTYYYERELPSGATQLCCVTVFAMKVSLQRESWPEQDRRTTKWHPIQRAAKAVHEAELRKLILAFVPR